MDRQSGGGGCSAEAHGIRRQDIQAAILKAAELRALHAALLRGGSGGSPAVAMLAAGGSPLVPHGAAKLSVQEDYPVFAPSYEEDSLPGYNCLRPENRSLSQTWNAINGLEGEGKINEAVAFDNKSMNNEPQIPSIVELQSNRTSSINRMLQLQIVPESNSVKSLSERTSSGECRITTMHHNACKQEAVSLEMNMDRRNLKNTKGTVASCKPEQSVKMHLKHRGPVLSWLFPKSRKKTKPDDVDVSQLPKIFEMSPKTVESENMSQLLKEWGALSLESLKKELLEANENKDAALTEVSEMRFALGELQQKLVSLEAYCEELKKALKQATHAKSSQVQDKPNFSKRMKSIGGKKENTMPVSEEVMVEGFLQIVSEARLSVKQFCKTLVQQIEERDDDLSDNINLLLQPYQMMLNSKYSKGVIYHLEALVNQCLYQDFENCVFRENGSSRFLDPQQGHRENFSSFVSLRNLSWNEVLQKGTKFYSEDFSKFCDQKMSCLVTLLNWSRPWPEELLRCFFVAAKCIWMLHLLAFSFSPPLTILRVEENCNFDPVYMEDIPLERHRAQNPSRVKIMAMPGFYVQDRVLKCRVLCRHGSLP
ncbi:IRK-interacting protein-like [Curcuma longa]|uniref:IRK-interacting protein-like n=1 Tax=Curcuma longa TaxID=136217 RepID=UPI003D9F7A2B